MTDKELIRLFCRDQRRRSLAPGTIAQRRSSLMSLAEQAPLRRATIDDLEEWLDTRGPHPKTRATLISHLRAFYTWARANGHTKVNPAADLLGPRLPRYLPRPIATADLDLALAAAEVRTRLWLALAAFAGLRCKEIAGLRREDIRDEHPRCVVVQGKGSRERAVPLNPLIEGCLADYGPPAGGHIFPSPRRAHLTPSYVSGVCNEHLRSVGIGDTMHALRHWFATSVYDHSQDLRLTQELLGHASPQTTAVYAAWSQTRAAEVVASLDLNAARPPPDGEKDGGRRGMGGTSTGAPGTLPERQAV